MVSKSSRALNRWKMYYLCHTKKTTSQSHNHNSNVFSGHLMMDNNIDVVTSSGKPYDRTALENACHARSVLVHVLRRPILHFNNAVSITLQRSWHCID